MLNLFSTFSMYIFCKTSIFLDLSHRLLLNISQRSLMENFFRQPYSNQSQYENNILNQEDELHIQYEECNNTPTDLFINTCFLLVFDEIKPFDCIE